MKYFNQKCTPNNCIIRNTNNIDREIIRDIGIESKAIYPPITNTLPSLSRDLYMNIAGSISEPRAIPIIVEKGNM